MLGEKFWNYREAKRANHLLDIPSTIGMIGISWIICYFLYLFWSKYRVIAYVVVPYHIADRQYCRSESLP
jgi:hypothetical protein